MKQTYLFLFYCLLSLSSNSQTKSSGSFNEILLDSIKSKAAITAGRNQLLLMVAREQKKADVSDGVIDNRLDIDGDIDKTNAISNVVFKKVNSTIAYIENNETDDMVKRKYIGRVIENLKMFNQDMNDGYAEIPYYSTLFEHTYQIIRGLHNKNLAPYIKENIGKTVYLLAPLYDTDIEATNELMAGISDKYPEILIKKLRTIKEASSADIVVTKAAPRSPKIILNYATSTAVERDIVRRNKDPYVQAIIKIADSCTTPLKGIFFVQDYLKGKISISQINKITANDEEYFKKLVEMRQNYFTGDLRKSYDKELTHIASLYVANMNELHNSSDAVRFKQMEKLTATELYYVLVFGSDDLYTSSFLGCFNRLLSRMKPKAGDEFLNDLGKDKFRTFIRLCANYNTLSLFIATIKKENQTALMRSFVQGLDNTFEQDLEGATDVANSFGSINDSVLMASITQEIKNSREQDSIENNTRGFRIYDILYTMLTASNDSITKKFGIPPISVMPYTQLVNDSGVVVQQVFFFGDVDGKGVFKSYVNGFSAADWKVKYEENWVRISSIKGKPVVIYANRPLDEPDDEVAQNALQDFLDSNNIRPTVIIHRGHSYHLSSTLDHINYMHKVVILGACGAYQNLSTVLNASEDAQIVSTKQIGSGKINGPIIRAFNDRLLAGKDIDWIEMWAQLSRQFSGGEMKELFNDYVPPYKNLGAIFLKAYRKMGQTEE
ncbi:MAG TPA: hypothetical protein PLU17_09395 [Chitinophagaceae bacterium]|nr:hypothetical protein [Chitinophagaceae bacterium]